MQNEEKRYGRQEPTFAAVDGTFDYSYGDDIVQFYAGYGVEFTPAQKYELNLYGARVIDKETKKERFAGKTIASSRSRQTGKSFAARCYALFMAVMFGYEVLFTAQDTSTTKAHMDWMDTFISQNPDLAKLVKDRGIKHSYIDMGISFRNGGKVSFNTRTKTKARGKSFSIIIIDECQLYVAEQQKALQPTTIASPYGSQFIGIGSPPNPEDNISTIFRKWHDDAHDPDKESVWWLEWAIPSVIEDIYDVDIYYKYNPGMGYLIIEDEMVGHAKAMSEPLAFCIEYLGYWIPRTSYITAIRVDKWDACTITKEKASTIEGDVAYGVKFSNDGKYAAVSIAKRPKNSDDPTIVTLFNVVDLSNGIESVGELLAPNLKKSLGVLIDGKSNAENLAEYLRAKGFNGKPLVEIAKYDALGDACSMFLNAVNSEYIAHPYFETLNDAVLSCSKRKIGNSGAFGFVSNADPTYQVITESIALAYRLSVKSKRKPGRKMSLGL